MQAKPLSFPTPHITNPCAPFPKTQTHPQIASLSYNDAVAALTIPLPCCPTILLSCPPYALRFNPTKVRLLHALEIAALFAFLVFQSHKGAIAAFDCRHRCPCYRWFQSHNGAIAAFVTRLASSASRFQSHNGAIAAR